MWNPISASLTGHKASGSKDAAHGEAEKEAKQDSGEARAGHPGYGANKKFPYIDE